MLLGKHATVEGLAAGLFRPVAETARCLFPEAQRPPRSLISREAFLLRLYLLGPWKIKGLAAIAGKIASACGNGIETTGRGAIVKYLPGVTP